MDVWHYRLHTRTPMQLHMYVYWNNGVALRQDNISAISAKWWWWWLEYAVLKIKATARNTFDSQSQSCFAREVDIDIIAWFIGVDMLSLMLRSAIQTLVCLWADNQGKCSHISNNNHNNAATAVICFVYVQVFDQVVLYKKCAVNILKGINI